MGLVKFWFSTDYAIMARALTGPLRLTSVGASGGRMRAAVRALPSGGSVCGGGRGKRERGQRERQPLSPVEEEGARPSPHAHGPAGGPGLPVFFLDAHVEKGAVS